MVHAMLRSVSVIAFAAGTTKAEKPATTETTNAVKKRERVEPVVIGISSTVAMPTNVGTRGSKSIYDFDALEVGQSIGLANKTAAQLRAVVSNANVKRRVVKKDAEGKTVYKMNPVKDANGVTVGQSPSTEPEMVSGKIFFVVDTDPATDPEKATARIFRKA